MTELPYPYDAAQPLPPPEWQPDFRGPVAAWCALAVFGLCLILVNVSYCWVAGLTPSSPFSYLIGFNSGGIGAQVGLLAIYAVFGPQRAWVRQVVALVIGMFLALLWAIGHLLAVWTEGETATAFPFADTDVVFADMLPLPAVFLAACAPLWVLRTLARWHIVRADAPPLRLTELSISGILTATLIVALSLGLVRLGRHLAEDETPDFWIGTGIGAAFSAGISLLTLPFCAWAILKSRILLPGIFAALCWLVLLTIGFVCVMSALAGNWPDAYGWVQFACLVVGYSLFLLGPLIAVRFFDYRLKSGSKVWPRGSKITPPSGG